MSHATVFFHMGGQYFINQRHLQEIEILGNTIYLTLNSGRKRSFDFRSREAAEDAVKKLVANQAGSEGLEEMNRSHGLVTHEEAIDHKVLLRGILAGVVEVDKDGTVRVGSWSYGCTLDRFGCPQLTGPIRGAIQDAIEIAKAG